MLACLTIWEIRAMHDEVYHAMRNTLYIEGFSAKKQISLTSATTVLNDMIERGVQSP